MRPWQSPCDMQSPSGVAPLYRDFRGSLAALVRWNRLRSLGSISRLSLCLVVARSVSGSHQTYVRSVRRCIICLSSICLVTWLFIPSFLHYSFIYLHPSPAPPLPPLSTSTHSICSPPIILSSPPLHYKPPHTKGQGTTALTGIWSPSSVSLGLHHCQQLRQQYSRPAINPGSKLITTCPSRFTVKKRSPWARRSLRPQIAWDVCFRSLWRHRRLGKGRVIDNYTSSTGCVHYGDIVSTVGGAPRSCGAGFTYLLHRQDDTLCRQVGSSFTAGFFGVVCLCIPEQT